MFSAEIIRGARILLAEDNPINQKVAIAVLEKSGAEVQLATNGLVALELALHQSYDAILMDCQMPEMDGIEATRQIRARKPDGRRVPIIAMTASVMAEDRRACFEAGMDDYIAKPVQSRRLVETLSKWLEPER